MPRGTLRRDRPVTAFVLSGGGNQGISQVGMLRALLERGIVPDVLIGTSAGSLNAAAIARDPTLGGVELLEEVWLGVDSDLLFPGGRLQRVWNVLRRDDHLIPNRGLVEVLRRTDPPETFADLSLPMRVVTCDLESGEEVVLAGGPLIPALLASCALPGIFPPVRHDGHVLVDGAVVNSVPISHALAGPCDRLYVMDVSGPTSMNAIRSPLDVVVRAFSIARDQRFDLERQYVPREVDLVVLPSPLDDRPLLDFTETQAMLEQSYKLAVRALDDHEQGRERPWLDVSARVRHWWESFLRPREMAADEGRSAPERWWSRQSSSPGSTGSGVAWREDGPRAK